MSFLYAVDDEAVGEHSASAAHRAVVLQAIVFQFPVAAAETRRGRRGR